jgi:hypothetical protein
MMESSQLLMESVMLTSSPVDGVCNDGVLSTVDGVLMTSSHLMMESVMMTSSPVDGVYNDGVLTC